MKISPEVLLNNKDKLLYNKILVTGSDESFIKYVRGYIVKKLRKQKYLIDVSGSYNKGITGDLFSEKRVLFLLKEYNPKKNDLEGADLNNHSILIASPNGKKINLIKSEFSRSKESLVVECYPLNKKNKELVLRQYINSKNLHISSDIFWYIVENFDNQYVFFIKQLETISLLGNSIVSVNVVEKAVFVDNKIDLTKVLFHIFKNNKYLINIFNKNIYSQTDFYIFLNSLKSNLEIISSSNSKELALSKFPRYLFNEKDIFLKIYNHLNKEKIMKIYRNISKAERVVRKNSNLYNIIGLRFLLNTKKIITS